MAASKSIDSSEGTAKPPKIIDVNPGTDAAAGNSRGTIITNRTILKDPMMAEPASGEPEDQSSNEPPLQPPADTISMSKPRAIIPISEAGRADEPADEATEPAAAEPSAVETESQVDESITAEPASEEVTPAPDNNKSEEETELPAAVSDTTSSADGELADGLELDKKSAETDSKDIELGSSQLTPEQQKAVESGQYFLPIRTAESRRIRREVAFSVLFVLVLTAIWLDAVLDAELLHIGGLHAVTNFFAN